MMKRKLKNDWFLLCVAIIVFLINQLPFVVDMRPVMYDEAWYGNTAYNLTQGNGFLNAIVGKGGNSNFLLPLLTSVFMELFGYNLFAIRITAIFCGVITLILLMCCMRQLSLDWKPKVLLLLFFVTTPIFNTVFRFGRPECLSLMCTMGGLWFYFRYREYLVWHDMLRMSLFVFASGCAHPFGLFMFALIGASLFLRAIAENNKKILGHLLILLIMALVCIGLVVMISMAYNVNGGMGGIMGRFSIREAKLAVPAYFKEAFFSRAAVYMLLIFGVLVLSAFVDGRNRTLAIIALIHFVLFPFLFSTDLMMVGLGLDYVVMVAMVLLGPLIEQLLAKKKKWMVVAYCVYCMGCLGITYLYNYGVKFERANSLLTQEMHSIVPQGSKVFGPIRQWPMLMQTDYRSDHFVFLLGDVESYDYVILNSQDAAIYSTYRAFLPIDENLFELVYERPTRQYGIVQVYKTKR